MGRRVRAVVRHAKETMVGKGGQSAGARKSGAGKGRTVCRHAKETGGKGSGGSDKRHDGQEREEKWIRRKK